MTIESIHHVSLTVSDLDRSRQFYRELGLEEIPRPAFGFGGAWFQVGPTQQLHLIECEEPTMRGGKCIDTRDVHFALRVESFEDARAFLHSKGFREDVAPEHPLHMIARPNAVAGFPQIYILDPDRHIIEINASALTAAE